MYLLPCLYPFMIINTKEICILRTDYALGPVKTTIPRTDQMPFVPERKQVLDEPT